MNLIIVSLYGILRESGSRPVIEEVMTQLREKGEFVPTLAHQDAHFSVAVALKRYFRQTQGRLIPCYFVEEFNKSQSGSSEDLKIMFSQLDSMVYETAKFVFGFLVQIIDLRDVNKMTAANVAITTGPSLFDVDNSDVDSIKSCLPLTEFILMNYRDIFPNSEGKQISLTVLVSLVTLSSEKELDSQYTFDAEFSLVEQVSSTSLLSSE